MFNTGKTSVLFNIWSAIESDYYKIYFSLTQRLPAPFFNRLQLQISPFILFTSKPFFNIWETQQQTNYLIKLPILSDVLK